MKKILFLMAILPMILFTACSSDDDNGTNEYESQLIGTWVEDTDVDYEVLHVQFNADHTGYQWATDNGVIDEWGKDSFTWSATKTQITGTFRGEIGTLNYKVSGNRLTISSDGETIYYTKQ